MDGAGLTLGGGGTDDRRGTDAWAAAGGTDGWRSLAGLTLGGGGTDGAGEGCWTVESLRRPNGRNGPRVRKGRP